MMREPRDSNTTDTHATIGCELINRKFATDECNIPRRSDGADRISGLIKYHRNKHACRHIFTEFCDVTNPIVSRLGILDLELIPKMVIINCFPRRSLFTCSSLQVQFVGSTSQCCLLIKSFFMDLQLLQKSILIHPRIAKNGTIYSTRSTYQLFRKTLVPYLIYLCRTF